MFNLLCNDEDRTIMFDKILKSDNTYAEESQKYIELFNRIKTSIQDKGQLGLLLKLDSTSSYIEAIAQDLSYEKGFQDGVKFFFNCISKGGK